MPKPDQNVSSSAALQRPQRQKALPKPLPKDVAKTIETDLQPSPESHEIETVSENLATPAQVSSEFLQTESELPEPKPEVKPKLNLDELAIALKSKPKVKPILKPKIKPQIEVDAINNLIDPIIDPSLSEPNLEISNEQVQNPEILEEHLPELVAEAQNISIFKGSEENLAPENIEEDTEEADQVFESASEEDASFDSNADDERSLEFSYNPKSENLAEDITSDSSPIFWCQAVGLVVGKYVPSSDVFHKGELIGDNGFTYRGYVLSKAIKALEKKTDLSLSHQFVVYPKTSKVHGIRFEILATDVASKIEEFEDGQFNVRGLVTKQLEDSILIEIQRRPEYLHPTQYDRFSLEVKGTLPPEMIQQLLYVKCQLMENHLSLVSYEHLACPIISKSTLNKVEKPILKSKPQKIELDQSSQSLDLIPE